MAKYFSIAILGLALMGPGADSVRGQDNTLAEIYSRGVQAYFNGEHEKSHQFLTQAINLNSPDPRCYYFRGLANTKLGRPEDAAVDFKKGATLEALDAAEFYPVSKSLIRIQGSARLAIETVRRQAKVDLKGLREERRRIRYEQNKVRTTEVRRKPVDDNPPAIAIDLPALPIDATRKIFNPFDITSDKLSSSDLLAGQNSKPASGKPAIIRPVASTGPDPFSAQGSATKPAPGNNPADPFATKPAAGNNPADPFATKPPPGNNPADPFATKPAAGNNPADPFATKPAAGNNPANPFATKPPPGNNPADPIATEPAAGGGDPAAGADPADPPKKSIFGSFFRAVGVGVSKSIGDGEEGESEDNPAAAPKPEADPFGGDTKPAPKPGADPFGGNDPFKQK
jgi:hypothetical protein